MDVKLALQFLLPIWRQFTNITPILLNELQSLIGSLVGDDIPVMQRAAGARIHSWDGVLIVAHRAGMFKALLSGGESVLLLHRTGDPSWRVFALS